MKYNVHGQPAFESISLKYNKEKALLALRGMLEGMNADHRLNEMEVLFLDTWLKTDVKYIDDGDILDLRDLVTEVLADGEVSAQELQNLKELIADVLDYGEGTASETDGLTNQLLGFIKGVTAELGATPQRTVTQKTDCLVLVTMASRDWKFSSYGRKIQSVLENRKKGLKTLIISEQCWCRIAGY